MRAVAVAILLLLGVASAAAQCKTFTAKLGEWCDEKQGTCCGGGPKNAKCANYVCTTTYPVPAPGPPAAQGCQKYGAVGSWCEEKSGNCCAGGPKNTKCTNYVCVANTPTPAPTPAPTPTPSGGCKTTTAQIGQKCDMQAGICCGGGPKNTSCKNGVCVSNYPAPGTSGRKSLL